MYGSVVQDLVLLPPVADDPIFSEALPETSQQGDLAPRRGSDPHEFAALFIRHRWSFALHARRFLQDQRDIDEVVQEGFLRLFLALPELETELQALAYGRRTITNLCIDRYRADQRRPRLVDLESIPASAFPDDDDETDPVIQAEDAAIVREALAMLSPLHREALIKREIEEKSLPQIAAELDIPVEQVKHVLHRARRSLRRLLVGTHVEPGVDLDVAMLLAANRARAARAAKPVGVAVLTLLLVLAGVVGLRSSQRSAATVEVEPPARGLAGLLGGGDAPRHVVRPGSTAPPARVQKAPVSQFVHPALARSRPPQQHPTATPRTTALVTAPTTIAAVGRPVVAVAPPDVTLLTSQGSALVPGRVFSQSVSSVGGQTVTSSGLAFARVGGSRTLLSQQLTFASGAVSAMQLSVLQTGSGASSMDLKPDTSAASLRSDGSTEVIASGHSEVIAGDPALTPLTWTLSVVLDQASGAIAFERLVLDSATTDTSAGTSPTDGIHSTTPGSLPVTPPSSAPIVPLALPPEPAAVDITRSTETR